MNAARARFAVTVKRCALAAAAWLLGVTCTVASPITIGTFEIQNDTSDPFFTGPTFVVTNDSGLAGLAATFSDIHLLFDLQDLTSLDFSLASLLGSAQAVDSGGLADALGQSLLPDLGTVLDAYLTFTLLDAVTNAILPGTLSLGPTDPALCSGCTDRMTDFTHGSTLAIQFDAQAPVDTAPVPEPMSLLLLGSGLAAGAAARRWRTR
jgi:hypothetical protein